MNQPIEVRCMEDFKREMHAQSFFRQQHQSKQQPLVPRSFSNNCRIRVYEPPEVPSFEESQEKKLPYFFHETNLQQKKATLMKRYSSSKPKGLNYFEMVKASYRRPLITPMSEAISKIRPDTIVTDSDYFFPIDNDLQSKKLAQN